MEDDAPVWQMPPGADALELTEPGTYVPPEGEGGARRRHVDHNGGGGGLLVQTTSDEERVRVEEECAREAKKRARAAEALFREKTEQAAERARVRRRRRAYFLHRARHVLLSISERVLPRRWTEPPQMDEAVRFWSVPPTPSGNEPYASEKMAPVERVLQDAYNWMGYRLIAAALVLFLALGVVLPLSRAHAARTHEERVAQLHRSACAEEGVAEEHQRAVHLIHHAAVSGGEEDARLRWGDYSLPRQGVACFAGTAVVWDAVEAVDGGGVLWRAHVVNDDEGPFPASEETAVWEPRRDAGGRHLIVARQLWHALSAQCGAECECLCASEMGHCARYVFLQRHGVHTLLTNVLLHATSTTAAACAPGLTSPECREGIAADGAAAGSGTQRVRVSAGDARPRVDDFVVVADVIYASANVTVRSAAGALRTTDSPVVLRLSGPEAACALYCEETHYAGGGGRSYTDSLGRTRPRLFTS